MRATSSALLANESAWSMIPRRLPNSSAARSLSERAGKLGGGSTVTPLLERTRPVPVTAARAIRPTISVTRTVAPSKSMASSLPSRSEPNRESGHSVTLEPLPVTASAVSSISAPSTSTTPSSTSPHRT